MKAVSRGTPRSTTESMDNNPNADGEFVISVADSFVAQSPESKIFCHFSCKRCGNLAKEPVINVICGHLFCWRCLYLWLAPSCLSEQGSRRGCPFCKSHVDISPTMSTVIPVCSGPEPGVDHSLIGDSASEPDEEEKNRKHAVLERGEEYVPLRPAWYAGSKYCSRIDLIADMLWEFCGTRSQGQHSLSIILQGRPGVGHLTGEKEDMVKLVQHLKDGRLWLTGEKYPIQEKMEQQEVRVALLPTDAKFPDVSTFTCKICEKIAAEPVVTMCGHLFCWTCLWHEINGFSQCPVCKENVKTFSSRSNINSIYCMANDPKKEDAFLKSSRKKLDQVEIPAPCRPDQTVAAPFLDYLIEKVRNDGDLIVGKLDVLQSKFDELNEEEIKKIISETHAMWDELFVNVVKKWRNDCNELKREHLISLSFLDVEARETIKQEGEDFICQVDFYMVDKFGDMIN